MYLIINYDVLTFVSSTVPNTVTINDLSCVCMRNDIRVQKRFATPELLSLRRGPALSSGAA
ncbi:hypothetical protein P7K49_012394 [Saguinus oedipus]|uniref:Uncharacterized protein n=1 Tax=Saguinus oedipus TaxID=9490 RepID=A0ABQ9VTL6_SAGOE|nr:hypothetical protein P7K49_012394 [Saguinus oedipus]